jgi:hypothetical protein
MSKETGRSIEEQEAFERELVRDLEDAQYATNNWRDKVAPSVYATRFIDAMIRIQARDINTVEMKYEIDPAGQEIVLLTLPVVRPHRRTWISHAHHRVSHLEHYEPNIRLVLPERE